MSGIYLDTGDGPRRLEPSAEQRAAWNAYYAHSRDCAECERRLFNCREGAALWQWFIDAREAE